MCFLKFSSDTYAYALFLYNNVRSLVISGIILKDWKEFNLPFDSLHYHLILLVYRHKINSVTKLLTEWTAVLSSLP